MPFYPLLEGPECNGSVELFNFAPNDWEDASFRERFLNVSWADGSLWHSKCISVVSPGASVSVSRNDLSYLPKSKFGFLSLSKNLLPETTDILPSINDCHTLVPNWRSSLGLNDFDSRTLITIDPCEIIIFLPRPNIFTCEPII